MSVQVPTPNSSPLIITDGGTPVEISGSISSEDTFYQMSTGNIPGTSYINKFGSHSNVSTSLQSLTEVGGIYNYLTTPSTLYISSSNSGDTQTYRVFGLDENKNLQVVDVTAIGQSQQALPGSWTRVFRVYNNGSTDNAGDIYIAESDTLTDGVPDTTSGIKARILPGYNQTLLALYTIPSGHTGYLKRLRLYQTENKNAEFRLLERESGGVFRTVLRDGIPQNGYSITYDAMPSFPEESDIEVRALFTEAATGLITCNFDLIIVQN